MIKLMHTIIRIAGIIQGRKEVSYQRKGGIFEKVYINNNHKCLFCIGYVNYQESWTRLLAVGQVSNKPSFSNENFLEIIVNNISPEENHEVKHVKK